MKKCRPRRYAVIASNGKDITYGFRCREHHILTRRFATEELREQRLEEHRTEAKKEAKKS